MNTFVIGELEAPLIIIDTPSFGDSEGSDPQNVASIINAVRTIKYVNALIICLNSEEPKLD